MFENRKFSYLLIIINALLISFIVMRSDSSIVPEMPEELGPLTIIAIDTTAAVQPDTLMLMDFESERALANIYDQGGVFSLHLADAKHTHGKHGLLMSKDHASNCEFAITYFPWNWGGYDFFEFDIYNDSKENGSIWVRIGDNFDSKKFYIRSQKYAKGILIVPGANTISIPISEIVDKFGYMPARKSLSINFPANDGYRYVLDFFRVVRK